MDFKGCKPKRIKDGRISENREGLRGKYFKMRRFEWPEFESRVSALQGGTHLPTRLTKLHTLPVLCFHHLQQLDNIGMSYHLHDFRLSPHISSDIFILMGLLLVYYFYSYLHGRRKRINNNNNIETRLRRHIYEIMKVKRDHRSNWKEEA